MAKINFGPVVNDARGKTAGIVYSKNRSGAYVRTKVTPTNPRTLAQVTARSYLTTFAQAWSGVLTAAERAAWATFATTYPTTNIFGNALTLNGLNMYVRINTVLSQIGATPLILPPSSPSTTPIPLVPDSFNADSSAPSYVFQQSAAVPTAGTLFYVYSTGGLAAGRNPSQSDYRLLGPITPATTGFPAPIAAYALQAAKFGDLIPGLSYAILVSTVDPAVGIPTVATPFKTISI